MKITLIITTYNRPEALAYTLKSACNQVHQPDEIIVADDGSTMETARLIEKIAENSPIPVYHSWHEDAGFRAAMVRNRAIAVASSPYIVMIDGDLVLHPKFILDHKRAASEGCFVQAHRVLLSPSLTDRIIGGGKKTLHWYDAGLGNRQNAIRCNGLSLLLAKRSTTPKGVRSCNMAFFRKDVININGFDNSFVGWGREDSEFVSRMFASGIRRKELRFGAIVYHLYHPPHSRESLHDNDLRLSRSRERNLSWCEDGISRFMGD